MRNLIFVKFLVVILLLGFSSAVFADQKNFKVLGVIASVANGNGIALLKDVNSGKTFAVREGKQFAEKTVLALVERKTITVMIENKPYHLKVGDETASASLRANIQSSSMVTTGLEKRGDTVSITASFRDHLVKEKLSEVLMQAAAVPYFKSGELVGFRIWDITPGSIYEKVGLKDGDIVKEINEHALNDVRNTVKLLHSLKNETLAEVNILRDGAEKRLKIVVQ